MPTITHTHNPPAPGTRRGLAVPRIARRRAWYCKCPGGLASGGRAKISSDGWCPRCGVTGPRHAQAVRAAYAAGNPRPLAEYARAQGHAEGYAAGLAQGRREVIDALTAPGGLLDIAAAAGWGRRRRRD